MVALLKCVDFLNNGPITKSVLKSLSKEYVVSISQSFQNECVNAGLKCIPVAQMKDEQTNLRFRSWLPKQSKEQQTEQKLTGKLCNNPSIITIKLTNGVKNQGKKAKTNI